MLRQNTQKKESIEVDSLLTRKRCGQPLESLPLKILEYYPHKIRLYILLTCRFLGN